MGKHLKGDKWVLIKEMYNIVSIMAYGSMPYVGMVPKKNAVHIKSAQMTRLKCRCKISQRLPWAPSGIIECFHEQWDR